MSSNQTNHGGGTRARCWDHGAGDFSISAAKLTAWSAPLDATAKTNTATTAQLHNHGLIADPLLSPVDVKVGVHPLRRTLLHKRPEAFTGLRDLRGWSACQPQSGHLGHTQVSDRQLELAHVEHLCAYFLAARGSDLSNWSLFRSIASTLSKVAEETTRPDARSTSRLALQNPSSPSSAGRIVIL